MAQLATTSAGRESLSKYLLRPPVAQERVKLVGDDLVRIELRRPFRDGTVAIDLDPLSLLCRLAASVPPPKMHGVRYSGVLSAAHQWRSLVVPPPPAGDEVAAAAAHAHRDDERPATHRSRRRSWAELMMRTFAIDVEKCGRCGAQLALRALVTLPASIERFLRHLGEPTEPLPLSPARDPPFFKSRALRRKLGELEPPRGQVEMFGG